jgi:hypothetical protein
MWKPFRKRKTSTGITPNEVKAILHAYGDLLCDREAIIQDESCLPTTKDRIKKALIVAIATAQNDEERSHYKSAYLFLSSFQPGVGAKPPQLPPEGFNIDDLDKYSDDIKRRADWAKKMQEEAKILQEELRILEGRLATNRE